MFVLLIGGIAFCGTCIPWHGLALKEEPFHVPASTGNWPAMQKLLDNGLPVDAEDENGDTPLWFAVTHDKIDFAQKLIDRGANVHHVDHNGWGFDKISSFTSNPTTLKWVEDKLGLSKP